MANRFNINRKLFSNPALSLNRLSLNRSNPVVAAKLKALRSVGRDATESLLASASPKQTKLAAYATSAGHFVRALPQRIEDVRQMYLEGKRTSLTRAPEGEVKRFGDEDLSADFNTIDQIRHEAIKATGRKVLSAFYYFTSGAGLWTRGGGQVKALIPYNLSELLPKTTLKRLNALNDLINAPSNADVLFQLYRHVPEGSDIDMEAGQIIKAAKAEIDQILSVARKDRRAMPPLAMKLVQAALMSKAGNTYVPFDVWTSEQTHKPIADYLEEFKKTFGEKEFHKDPNVQKEIVDALESYFTQAKAVGDTHLFGFQEGLPALDAKTGLPIEGTPEIGEGAGRAKAYLDKSGRTAQLLKMGKTLMSFENIEVLTPWEEVLGAHAESGKQASVVVVPQKKGYSGGNPFVVTKNDGSINVEFHEQSALPDEFATGNTWFNANTIISPLNASPSDVLGFEVKNRTQVRAKNNAADLWHLATGAIGGKIGLHYENFKKYSEYVENGTRMIEAYRDQWAAAALSTSANDTSSVVTWFKGTERKTETGR